jgi:Ca2+/H+ antiporter, TMEM165/GDT1 family
MHASSDVTLAVAVFLASAVESVEALTIIVAAGVSRGWRPALEGTAAALAVLIVLVGALGPALVYLVPINVLRTLVGALLLVFGLQWLRKAILRTVGLKAKHDEDTIFREQVEALTVAGASGGSVSPQSPDAPVSASSGSDSSGSGSGSSGSGSSGSGSPGTASSGQSPVAGARPKRDATGFAVAFKGTFLEGLEIAIIVLGLGAGNHQLALAAAAAAAAIVVVAIIGLIVARQLAGVPENAMKTVVGLMLVSFGTFWAGEGLGVSWPGSDLAIPVLVGVYAVVIWLLVQAVRPTVPRVAPEQAHAS